MDHLISELDKRLSIVETKIAEVPNRIIELHTKVDNNQKKSDDIGLRMYTVMEEIKNEITSYKLTKADEELDLMRQITSIDHKIDIMNNKYSSIYKTITVVAGILTTVMGAAYAVFTFYSK